MDKSRVRIYINNCFKVNMNLNKKVKKDAKNFAKYLIIGIIWTIFYVYLMKIVIDIMKIPTLIGSTLAVSLVFIGKFYSYVLVKLMKNGVKNLLKYASIDSISIVLNITLVWFFIDILRIPTVISSSTVVIILFIGRFIVFKVIGLIK